MDETNNTVQAADDTPKTGSGWALVIAGTVASVPFAMAAGAVGGFIGKLSGESFWERYNEAANDIYEPVTRACQYFGDNNHKAIVNGLVSSGFSILAEAVIKTFFKKRS